MNKIKYLIIKNIKIDKFSTEYVIKNYYLDNETLIIDSSLEEGVILELSSFEFKLKTIEIENSEILQFEESFIYDLKELKIKNSICSFSNSPVSHIAVFSFFDSKIEINNSKDISKLYLYLSKSEVLIKNSSFDSFFLYMKDNSVLDSVDFKYNRIFKEVKDSKIIRI